MMIINLRLAAAALVACFISFAQIPANACSTPCTKAQITTDINANWPDNTSAQITPAQLRSTVLELVNSYLDVNGASSFTCPTHQFLVSIVTLSSYGCAQPAVADLSTATTGSGSIVLGTGPAIGTPAISGGTVDGAAIGGVTPGAGTFTIIKLGAAYSVQLTVCTVGVNFNLSNTDNTIALPLPTGVSSYTVSRVQIANASGSISTATAGLFTSTGGGGVTIAATQALTVTTAAANTNNNTMILTLTNPNTTAYNVAALQFRTTTPQGSAVTADVCINYLAAP